MKKFFFQKLLFLQLILAFFFIGACDNGDSPKSIISVFQGNVQIENQTGIYDFGSIDFKETSADVVFTITNKGLLDLLLTGNPTINVQGSDSGDFIIDKTNLSTSLVTKSSTTFTIKFSPIDPGIKTIRLSIDNNDDVNTPFTFTVTGKATPLYESTKIIGSDCNKNIRVSTIDMSGNLYISGMYLQNNSVGVDFGADFGVNDVKNCNKYATFVTKILANGSYGWTRQIKHNLDKYAYSEITDIASDSIGNIYISGYFTRTIDFGEDFGITDKLDAGVWSKAFIMKITSEGEYKWTKVIGNNTSSTAINVLCDSKDNLYFTVHFRDAVDFGAPFGSSYSIISTNKEDSAISKIDQYGNYIWTKHFVCSSRVHIKCLEIDDQENIYMAGIFNGTADFGIDFGTSDIKSNTQSTGVFVTKISSNLNYCYTRMISGYGGTSVESMVIDSNSNIYISGNITGIVDFGVDFGVTETKTVTVPAIYDPYASYSDLYLMKVNADSSYGWVKQFGNEFNEYYSVVQIDSYDNIYFAGSFIDQIDFGKDFGVSDLSNTSGYTNSTFLTKIKSDGSYCWTKCIEETDEHVCFKTLSINSTDNIFITGEFGKTIDFGKSFGTSDIKTIIGGYSDLFIMKLQG